MNRLLSLFVLSISQLVLFSQVGWAADDPIPLQQVQEEETKYTLTLNSIPANACSFNRSSGGTFAAGQSVYMYYNVKTDYVFDYWQSGDTIVSRERYFYFTMPNHDATLTAVFHYDPTNPGNPNEVEKKYVLTLNTKPANAGSFNRSSGEQFTEGQSVSLRAYNNTDFVFSHWMENGEQIARNASFNYTMPAHNAELTAVYNYQPGNPANPDTAQVYYTVTLETQPANAGSFSWNNNTQRIAGSSGYIYAYNNTDFTFREWQQDGQVVGRDRQYNFVMPAQNIKLVAVYDYNPSNPGNPGKNYWNEETGEVIVDDFSAGNLYDAVYYTTNGNYDAVQMITVAGPVSQYDWGVVNNYGNCTFLDMSRTYGMTYVPSYNFSGNQVLATIALPAGIEKIDYYAFNNCTSLSSLSIYAATPPTIGNRAFQGVPDGLIVYVPADALSLYQEAEGWKDFTILPLANQVSSLEVNLSSDENFNTTHYKDMFIELINTVSGQKLRYVITNRVTYTFNSLPKRTNYNVYLRNAQGDVLGQINDVAVGYDGQEDVVSVTFPEVKVPRDLKLTVFTPTGEDVTAQATITWFDYKDTYLTKGNTLAGQLEGVSVKYRVQLPQTLAMLYQLPADATYEVQAANDITLTLTDIPQTTIGGRVHDIKTGQPLSGATVAVSQMLNGLYSKSFTTKTDNKGQWSLQVYEAKTDITASMDDYMSKTQSFEAQEIVGSDLQSPTVIPDFQLKDISGTTISIGLTYQPTGGELQEFYSDYANVAYTVYNETTSQTVTELNVQYPQIVLMEQLPAGTVLRITATSKNQKFVPVSATSTVDSLDRASVTLPIVQLGGITASFRQTDNPSVVGILYDGNGRMLKKYDYASATLTISELQDGQYTLVTMASTQLFNSVGSIAQFAEAGLREGVDYVKNTVTVKSGEMTAINNSLIPFLDETKLYYTGDGTSITVNKSQVTTGNYLTITGHLDFKSAYADQVSDVKLIVNLPEESAFVDNSVMRGAQTATYTYADGQVIVPLDYYSERVRFCFIPTAGGEFTATGSVQFTLGEKTITQPIGKANFTVKDLSISVPSTVAKTTMLVSGTALGKSSVEIYDDGMLIGNTTSLANGTWEATCELNNPYNLSTHNIYAKVTTKAGLELVSETKQVMYDVNMIVPEKVTMLYYNPEFVGQYNIVFDLINGTVTPKHYYFFPYKSYPNWWGSGTEPKDFTFIADLSNNDSTAVSGVTIRVYTDNGYWRNLEAQYNTSMNRWVAVSQFVEEEAPVGVDVEIEANTNPVIDLDEMLDLKSNIAASADEIKNIIIAVEGLDLELEPNEFDEALKAIDEDYETDYEDVHYYDNLTDEELNSLLSDLDDIDYDSEMASFEQYLDIIRTQFANEKYFQCSLEDGSLIKVESCEGVNTDNLEGEGFTIYKTTEGLIYVRSNENGTEFVDISQGIHYTIVYNNIYGARRITAAEFQEGLDKFNDLMEKLNDCYQPIAKAYEETERMLGSFVQKALDAFNKAKQEVPRCLTRYNMKKAMLSRLEAELANTNSLSLDYVLKKAEVDACKAEVKQAKALLNAAKRCRLLAGTAYNLIKPLKGVFTKALPLAKYADVIYTGVSTVRKFQKVYIAVPRPCKDDEPGADKIRGDVIAAGVAAGTAMLFKVGFQALADLATVGQIAAAPETGGVSVVTAVATVAANIALSLAIDKAFSYFVDSELKYLDKEIKELKPRCNDNKCPRCGKNPCECKDKCPRCGNRPCTCPDKCPFCGQNPCVCPRPHNTTDVEHDPSGYVYEGVASNRLQGVKASCYYKETVEDMYGDLHENVVLWDAEEYAQENPLFTDEYGMYRWDVPKGLWQVKFEKEGYQTTYSEWLPVPPPQLEVNIGMTQMLQPSVKSGLADSKGVEVTFDKYMDPETLTTDNIIVTKNGEKITDGTIELLDEEVAYEGKTETFASKVRFNVAEGDDNLLLSTDEVMLTVKKAVKSYAGVQMQDDYTQKFDVEPRVASIAVDELFNIGYGAERTITVAALPTDASKGKKMKVQSLSTMIASVSSEELILDENGQAELIISGELPGSTVINFQVEDTDVEGQTTINVKDATKLVTIAPRASRVSGTQVYRGTEIRLTSETEGAEIWYTLDGSCPCNTETALKYNPDEPIIIAGDSVKIKAIAIGHDLAESDVSEFSYTLKTTALGYQLSEGWTWVSHNIEEGVSTTAFATNAERIVGQTNEMIKDPVFGLVGGLQTMLPTEAYKLKLSAQTSNRLEGYEFNARDNRVPLRQGWNWIGYPVNQAMTLSEAFAYFEASEGDYLVGQDGYAEYVDGKWQGTLEGMIPGQGFVYKSATTTAIPFNTAIVSTASSRMGKRNTLKGSPWAPAKNLYPNVMPLTAEVYNDGVKVSEEDFVVGAFAESECRSVGQWKDGRLLMTVYGDLGEDIRFVATQTGSDRFFDITEHVNFTPDNIGNWHNPIQLTLGSEVTAVKKVVDGQLNVTPAVAHDHITVSVSGRNIGYVSLTAMNGQTVISVSNVGKSATISTSQLPAGIYIVTVQAEGQSYYKKMLKTNN